LSVGEAFALQPGALPLQQAAILESLTKLVEIGKRPPEEQRPLLDEWQATAGRLPPLARMLVPASGKLGVAFLRSHAEARCAITAVAAERYRRAHGRWPNTPDELVAANLLPAVPADPFGGQPLRLARIADGIVVSSAGPDGKGDTAFRLWDVAQRRRAPEKELTTKGTKDTKKNAKD
jgi:hypothetical protein